MKTKHLLQNGIYVIVGIIAAIGLSYIVHASGTFNDASGQPTANNTAMPLNVGTADQIKQGGLAVTAFIANQNAELDGNTYFGGTLYSDPANNDNAIHFGGTDPVTNSARTVSLALTGGFQNSGTLIASPLTNTSLAPLCADGSGTIVLCAATDMCSNISGTQTVIPTGYVRNSDGTCTIQTKRFYSITSIDKSVTYFTGNVVSSHVTYHVPGQRTGYPLIAVMGLTNDMPAGWVVDDISNIQATSMGGQNSSGDVTSPTSADSYSTLLSSAEAGSYNVKISSKGNLGIEGKFASDANFIGADFYMRIHSQNVGTPDQWIHLDNNTATSAATNSQSHEPYPVAGKTTTDFGGFLDGGSSQTNPFFGINFGGKGDQYAYVPYNFTFQKTIQLNSGDAVSVYAFIYGISTTGGNGYGSDGIGGVLGSFGSGDFHNSPNNFYYSFETPAQGTVFDITETPSV